MKCHVIHFVKKRDLQDAKAMWITPPSTDIFSLTLLYTSCTVPSFLRTNLPDDPSGKITCTMTPSASASSLPAKHKNRKWWNNHMMIPIVLIRIPIPLGQYNKNFERFERNFVKVEAKIIVFDQNFVDKLIFNIMLGSVCRFPRPRHSAEIGTTPNLLWNQWFCYYKSWCFCWKRSWSCCRVCSYKKC